jgi:CubicO group peptidase (beta-lactamase class C family)
MTSGPGALPRLPQQTPSVAWPTDAWPEAPQPTGELNDALDFAFSPEAEPVMGITNALLVVRGGCIIAERYGGEFGSDSTLPSWSMAKSMLHAVAGTLVREGRLSVEAPAAVPAWRGAGDERAAITLDDLLRMSDGLAFREEYVDGNRSDVIPMLFGPGKEDVAAFAESFPLAHAPGAFWSYSSGTSNIVSGIVARLFKNDPAAYERHMRRELFDRIGMRSASPRFDAAGTWIGSSFVFCTARDFARFGLLYLRDGQWDGQRILPEGWVDYARTVAPACATGEYGAHWWIFPERPGVFFASGYEGQRIVVAPEADVVIVRSAKTDASMRPAIQAFMLRLLDAAGAV